jgi:hypothetical protein
MEEGNCRNCFMDLQVHLLIHLVDDIELVSVISMRWIFFFERYMKTLKGYVQQKTHLEGCMVEGYVLNESFLFLCEFLGKDLKMGHASGMNNEHHILLVEKNYNLTVFK